MGTSCKKPSRVNTARAIDFVANFLVHVHSDMNAVLKDPACLQQLNLAIEVNKDSLVRRYEFDSTYRNIKVYLSSYKLRKAFGAPAETIWRKLFVRLNKGGWSPVTNQAYDSCWVLNQDAERRFMFAKQRYMGPDGITPEQLLAVLEGIDEKVVAPTEYVAADDEASGTKRIRGCNKRVMSRGRHRAVLRESQTLRAEVKAHNRKVFHAMRFQSFVAKPDVRATRAVLNQ